MNPAATSGFRGPLATVFEQQTAPVSLDDLLCTPENSLPIAPASNRDVWNVEKGTAHSLTRRSILAVAQEERTTAWPQPLASHAARFYNDGNRDQWEGLAFQRQHRLSRAAIAAATTLDPEWIDEVANGVTLLCEQSSWCWPAHDDSFAQHGSVVPTASSPFVDLGAGEVVGQLAWLDHLLGAQLDQHYPGLRARIRHEARIRIFEPFLVRRDWHWIGLDGDVHNWNPWIHGNILVGALRLLDDAADARDRTTIIGLSIEGLDRYVASLPADGAIDEGYAYWWNGACRALEALDILTHATNGRLDAVAHVPALTATIAFPHSMHLGGDWYLNLADGQSKPPAEQPWHALHRAARLNKDQASAAHASSHRDPTAPVAAVPDGLGRLLRAITDSEWASTCPASPPLPRDLWFPSTEVLLARERGASSAGLTLAVKGGHNAEHHNHNDVGSFVVASDGVPVIVDVGRPTYTATTFGPDRYSIWTMQSSWHNVPEIAGTPQSVGAEFRATSAEATVTDAVSELQLNLAEAYETPGLARWVRSARLERTTARGRRARIVVTDDWRWHPDSVEELTSIHLVVAGAVDLATNGALITPLEGAHPVVLSWTPDALVTTTIRQLADPVLADVWGTTLTRIELASPTAQTFSVTIEQDQETGRTP